MNNLIIIDDSTCKEDFNEFVSSHKDQIKLLLNEDDYNADFDILIKRIHDVFDNQKILFIQTNKSVIKITALDILFIIETDGKLFLHLKNNTKYRLPDSISYYKQLLSRYNILQINNKTLINADSINSFLISENILLYSNGTKFHIDEEFKQDLINDLNNTYK